MKNFLLLKEHRFLMRVLTIRVLYDDETVDHLYV